MWDPDDALSRLLQPLRLRGAYVSDWHLCSGWAVRGEPEPRALLHHMREGHAVIRLAGRDVEQIRAGDLAIFPRGAAHVVAEREDVSPQSIDRLLPDRQPGSADVLDLGSGERIGRMLCAGLDYDAAGEYPLYRTLPDLLIVRAETIQADRTFARIVTSLVAELDDERRSNTRAVTLRLFELIYVLGLRCALKTMVEPAPISRALDHPAIGRVLITMYEDYARRWSIKELASIANMSRASFAATFKDIVGETPAKHLRRRRLARARELIESTDLSQETIAREVGYESQVGLYLAFRAEYNIAPGALRHRDKTEPAAGSLVDAPAGESSGSV